VLVVDRSSRRVVIRVPVDGPEVEATALGALLAQDLETLDEQGFLKRHGRSHRRR
jgi:sarcosine oxidase gamma subunit